MKKDKLNFGCGKEIDKDFYNVDGLKQSGVDKVFDFDKFPYPLKSNHYNFIYCDNVLEHLFYPLSVIREFHRICKDGALIHIRVPYYNCAGAYNDSTHVNFFNRNAVEELFDTCYIEGEEMFRIQSLSLIPTRLGKIIPRFTREKISFIIGEVYSEIDVVTEVKK